MSGKTKEEDPSTSILLERLLSGGFPNLQEQVRAALKDDDLQTAFDELWLTWSSEMAAMIYADIIQVMDLILLTSIVDNRREIKRIKQDLS